VKAAGLLNTHMTRMFIEFARDKKDINPKDVFLDYNKVKPQIEKLLKDRDNSKLSELMVGFCTYMTTSTPDYDERKLQNVLDFLLVMPIDTAALFISQIDTFERTSKAFKYMTKIHMALMKGSTKYRKNFYEPIVSAGEGSL
jgi:hypothetical protein